MIVLISSTCSPDFILKNWNLCQAVISHLSTNKKKKQVDVAKVGGCGDDFSCEHELIRWMRNRRNVVNVTCGMLTVLIASAAAPINPADLSLMSHWWRQNHTEYFGFYLHLDAGDAALLSPVHSVGYVSARRPSEERWCPLDVSWRTQSGKKPLDLLHCL